MRKAATKRMEWKGSIETLEDRRVMSAAPVLDGAIEHHYFEEDDLPIQLPTVTEPDFWIDPNDQFTISEQLDQIEKTLSSAHGTTGLNSVLANYGFTGKGQTVAVIDSGIAYDHFALGGGFGANYRVVGGWDFTGENDANPYDDGPSGSHGTHVAGIIGASGGSDHGVAPGVDLVALRVFDDAGAGYFSWVENALRWVIQNRNSFENPITAINLSLGVASWNSSTIPSWTTLEDEFAQLESMGIFIAVSAGNSFASYNTPGLGYPAASPYVVPVMSVADNGKLANYSQRDVRAIAAPGSSIRSTVPDYKGNNNGVADDYATFSGTSMASPYVAGASVLIRQAMEFVGYTNITQDQIYDHMMATADSFLDTATNLTFKRLNLGKAISALMPTDDYGSTVVTAHNLGSLSGSRSVSGVISTLSDVDYFKFTATASGRVTFEATDVTHEMVAKWTLSGGTGTVSSDGKSFSFDVVAGHTYSVGVSSSGGLGYYDLDISSANTFTYTDWGTVNFSQLNGLSVSGEAWYRVVASQTGYLTIEGLYAAQGNQVSLQLYNSNMQAIVSGNSVNGTSRVDAYATAGQEFYVRVVGNNANVNYRLSNLVSVTGTTINVTGTSGNDTIVVRAGDMHQLTVNGATYQFSSIAVTNINLFGGAGNDSITIYGSNLDDTVYTQSGDASMISSAYNIRARQFTEVVMVGGGGYDTAYMYGSSGNDIYRTYGDRAVMSGDNYYNRASLFEHTMGFANSAGDVAYMYGSGTGDDTYRTYGDRVIMSGANYFNRAFGFRSTQGFADSAGDTAWMYGSGAGVDNYHTSDAQVVMSGANYMNQAKGFRNTQGFADSAADTVWMYGSAGDDIYSAYNNRVIMSGANYQNQANGYQQTLGFANTAGDIAYMYGSGTGDDTYRTYGDRVAMSGANYFNRAFGFRSTQGFADSAGDTAWMYGSGAGVDNYHAYSDHVVMSGANYSNRANGFSYTIGFADSANDIARLYGSSGIDTYRAYADRVIMSGTNYQNRADGFKTNYGMANDPHDVAFLYDSTGSDLLSILQSGTLFELSNGVRNLTQGFSTLSAYSLAGGNDESIEEAVDYLYSLIGAWT